MLGALLGGGLLGSTVFAVAAPAFYHRLFPPNSALIQAQDGIVRVASLFFVFVAGMDVDVRQVRQRARPVIWISVLGLVFPMMGGYSAVLLWPDAFFRGMGVVRGTHGLVIGAIVSLSALPVIARVFGDMGLLSTEFGSIVLAAAAVDDVVGWVVFAMLWPSPASGNTAARVLLAAGILMAPVLLLPRPPRLIARLREYLRANLTDQPGGAVTLQSLLVLGSAALFLGSGLSASLGAFLAGAFVGQTRDPASRAREAFLQLTMGFFAPLYFVSIGLRTDFIAAFDGRLVLILLSTACMGKVVGAGAGALLGKMSRREALAVGFGMNARGAIGIVLSTFALDAGLIDQRIFVALIIVSFVTSLLSGPAIGSLLRLEGRRAEPPPARVHPGGS